MRVEYYSDWGVGMWFAFFFFFNDTATTEIYTLPLHDALPISFTSSRSFSKRRYWKDEPPRLSGGKPPTKIPRWPLSLKALRSEEHTSELQSQSNLVCRLLLEKKNNTLIQCDLITSYKEVITYY